MIVDEEKTPVTWEMTRTNDGEFMRKPPTGVKLNLI